MNLPGCFPKHRQIDRSWNIIPTGDTCIVLVVIHLNRPGVNHKVAGDVGEKMGASLRCSPGEESSVASFFYACGNGCVNDGVVQSAAQALLSSERFFQLGAFRMSI